MRAHAIAVLFALAVLPALSSCGAGLAAAIAAAVPIADRALDWITKVEQHVVPLMATLTSEQAERLAKALPAAREVATQLRDRGKAASEGDYRRALAGLEKALAELWQAALPAKVRVVGAPGLFGASFGEGMLGVPSACEIVRGAEACGASIAPAQGAGGTGP